MKRLSIILLALATAFASAACTDPGTASPGGSGGSGARNPVVFIHGYTADMGGSMTAYMTAFRAAGWPSSHLVEFTYPSLLRGAESAARSLSTTVERTLARTGASKVDIVAHSEGNLVAETCMIFGGCKDKVDHWVNLTGAQNGTYLSPMPGSGYSAGDMHPNSPLVRRLNAAERESLTAQGVKSIVFWTPTDTIIIPGDRSKEEMFRNVQFIGNHFTILVDASIIAQSIQFVRS